MKQRGGEIKKAVHVHLKRSSAGFELSPIPQPTLWTSVLTCFMLSLFKLLLGIWRHGFLFIIYLEIAVMR